jgi:hypothetical protein
MGRATPKGTRPPARAARRPTWHYPRPAKRCPISIPEGQSFRHCTCGQLKIGTQAEVDRWWGYHRRGEEAPAPTRADRWRDAVEAAPAKVSSALGAVRRRARGAARRVAVAPSSVRAAVGEARAVVRLTAAVTLLAVDAARTSWGTEDEAEVTWHQELLIAHRRGRWWVYTDRWGREVRRLPILTGAAAIAAAGSNNWNTNGAWVGGVQPTAADDVTIPAGAVVTIPSGVTALCRSIIVAAAGTIAFAATSSNLNVGDAGGGAATFSSASTVTLTAIGTINFLASTASTTYQLSTGGKVMPNLTVNTASTTTIQFADAVTATGATVTLTAGKLDTNGQSVSASVFSSTNSNTRTLTLGASSMTLSGTGTVWNTGTITNLTMTSNTATITFSGAGVVISASSLNFNGASIVLSGSGSASIGGQTMAALTRTGTPAKTDSLITTGTPTVTGTLTLNSNSDVNRLLVQSNVVGTVRTITAAALVATNTVDFMDITGAGAATWTTAASGATAFGDAGGNSGITFTAAVTRYAVVAGNWSSTATWATTSGGAGGASVPLPQDNVFLDANSAAGTYTADMPRIGKNVDCTAFTRTLAFSSLATTVFGSLTLSSGMTVTGTQGTTFAGRGSHTMTFAGKTLGQSCTLNGPGGTYTLQDAAATTGASGFILVNGTFNTNGQSVTSPVMSMSAGTKTLTTGSTTWSLTSTSTVNIWTATTATTTINASSATLVIANASANTRTFIGAGHTYGTLTYTVAGSTGALVLTGANTFSTINVGSGRTLTLPSSTTTTVTNWNVNGVAGSLTTLNSSTPGTAATLSSPSGIIRSDYLSIRDSNATGGAAWHAGNNSTDVSGNTGWIFAAPTITGTASAALGGLGATAAATPTIAALGAATLGALSSTASATPEVAATATSPLGGLTATAAGTLMVIGSATANLGSLTGTAAGTPTVYATLTAPLGPLMAAAAGTVGIPATASAALGGLGATAAGSVSVTGTATAPLGQLSASATATVSVVGCATMRVSLEEATMRVSLEEATMRVSLEGCG